MSDQTRVEGSGRAAGEALPAMIQGLLRPESYTHAADDIQLHETHISWVVLAGEHVYKLKKPVNLGFLDFTTRQRRAQDCTDEVRLNRRLSPDVYLGLVEIVERDGAFIVSGPGSGGEPAVHMRRLPAGGMLPALLARGQVDVPLVQRIARLLARFHGRAATGAGIDEYGSPSVVRANWAENFSQMATFVGRTIQTEINAAIWLAVSRLLDDQQALLASRVANGRIRDGHGDLHTASICIDGGRILLFDCLQFAPRFRCSDVAAEVAFLAMDLEHHGRADLAWAFVNAYVRASGDAELWRLLDFYVCYRAYVRGKVRSLRLAQPGLSTEAERELESGARAYFDLAWAHAEGLTQPIVMVTMGLPASGKTTLAHALASNLGLVHLSSDVVRKELVGIRPNERRPETFAAGLYSPEMTERTYTALRRRTTTWLRRGRSVVLDATYGRPAERAAVVRLAERLGARLVVLVCHADDATLRDRLTRRASDTGTASDARLSIWPELRAAYSEPTEVPQAVLVDATASPEHMLAQALGIVRERLTRSSPRR